MKLKVLASGSTGNCYLLKGEKETLILECGIPYKEILKGLNYDLSKVRFALCSHSHKDHSKAIKDLLKNGIDVYTSKETLEAHGATGHRAHNVESEKQFKIGGFTILPFKLEHDVYNLGYLIQHEELGKLLFLTDTYYCKYNFSGLNHILIEANYSEEILKENIENEVVPVGLAARVTKSHFSLDNVKGFLKATDLKEVKEIVLIHLSGDNSNPKEFKTEIEKTTGKEAYIARKGLEIDLSVF
jgi:Metal-dependent hydrolases of the beta-lactamase superfamily I